MAEEEGKVIQWPGGADEATDFDFLMVGKDDKPIMKIPKEKLNEVIVINGEGVKAVAGGATSATPTILRPGPAGANRKMEDVEGWFVNGTSAEPPVATGTAWEAPAGKKNTNWWDGTTWSLGSSVPLPNGQGLLPLWDSSKVGGYMKDAQVRDANGVIYISLKDANTSALNVAGDWGVIFNGAITITSNKEFLYAIVDSNNVILWGKRRDGSTYDCDLSTLQYTDSEIAKLKSAMNALIAENKDRIISLEATREEYRQFKDSIDAKLRVISNEEYLYAIVDKDDRLLWGKRKDGTTYDCDNRVDKNLASLNAAVAITNIKTVTNEEYIYAIVTSDNVLLWGKRRDGSTYDSDSLISRELELAKTRLNLLESRISVISNDEFLYAIVDKNNVLIWGKRKDGTTYDFDTKIPSEVVKLTERLNFYDSKISVVSNPEYLWAIVDSDNRFIEGISREGYKHIIKANIGELVVNNLNLSSDALTELQKDLKDAGFKSGTGDWSESSSFRIPIPRVPAKINLVTPSLPTTKTSNIKGYIEYYDFEGNFFKKAIVLNAQGDSSMEYDKKNFSVDLDDGSKIKFGDWVEQDSWHMKAHYTDAFKSNNNAAYDMFEALARKFRPYQASRVWDYVLKQGQTISGGVGRFKEDFDTGARGFPDGFPTAVYYNGAFYGIYMFNLKKHRDNYKMDRGNEKHIHIDGDLGFSEIFNGTVNWTKFEIRNPSPRQNKEGWILETTAGGEYNGDAPTEIANTGKSGLVKASIQRLADSVLALQASPTKEVFESYFTNLWMFADYLILANIVANGDAFRKNWQWVTYDGGNKWAIAPYDWDGGIGVDHLGNVPGAVSSSHLGITAETPMKYFWQLYSNDVKLRYKELKDAGFLKVYNVFAFYKNRVDWIGVENFDKENKKWVNMPSYRATNVNSKWVPKDYTVVTSPINYDDSTTYAIGSEVVYGIGAERYIFVAKEVVTGVPPISTFYASYPRTLGFYNSLTRVYKWLEERINVTNNIYSI